MIVTNEQAVELLDLYTKGETTEDWEGFDLKFEFVHEELVDTSRWSHIYERIYKDLNSGKFYVQATEQALLNAKMSDHMNTMVRWLSLWRWCQQRLLRLSIFQSNKA